MFRSCCFVAGLFLSAQSVSANPILVNGSFEGGVAGWDVTIPLGISEESGGIPADPEDAGDYWPAASWFPAGTVEVIDSFRFLSDSAPDGDFFVSIASRETGYFIPGQDIDITVRQSIRLEAGALVSGWSALFNADDYGHETGFVRILDSDGSVLATPWLEHTGDLASVPNYTSTPWMPWSWRSPSYGTYTVVLGLNLIGDNVIQSRSFHDGIHVTPRQVPEPSSGLLLALALLVGHSGSPVAASRMRTVCRRRRNLPRSPRQTGCFTSV
jgi:hypothetical protein